MNVKEVNGNWFVEVPVRVSWSVDCKLPIPPDHEAEMGYVEELMYVRKWEIEGHLDRPLHKADVRKLPGRNSTDAENLAHDRGFFMGVYCTVDAMFGEKVAKAMLERVLTAEEA